VALTANPRCQRREKIRGHCEVVLQRIEEPLSVQANPCDRRRGRRIMPPRRGGEAFEQFENHSRGPRKTESACRAAVDPTIEQHEKPVRLIAFAPEDAPRRRVKLLEMRGDFRKRVEPRVREHVTRLQQTDTVHQIETLGRHDPWHVDAAVQRGG